MSRSKLPPSPCPMGNLLELLARPWTMHILWTLSHNGPQRFGVLRRQIEGISARVLTERLRTLEEEGFIFRHYKPTIPPAVTYGITDRMKDIEKVLRQLELLARKWQSEGAARNHIDLRRRKALFIAEKNARRVRFGLGGDMVREVPEYATSAGLTPPPPAPAVAESETVNAPQIGPSSHIDPTQRKAPRSARKARNQAKQA